MWVGSGARTSCCIGLCVAKRPSADIVLRSCGDVQRLGYEVEAGVVGCTASAGGKILMADCTGVTTGIIGSLLTISGFCGPRYDTTRGIMMKTFCPGAMLLLNLKLCFVAAGVFKNAIITCGVSRNSENEKSVERRNLCLLGSTIHEQVGMCGMFSGIYLHRGKLLQLCTASALLGLN